MNLSNLRGSFCKLLSREVGVGREDEERSVISLSEGTQELGETNITCNREVKKKGC